jgi:hypothetical protein
MSGDPAICEAIDGFHIFTTILNRAVKNRHDLKASPGGRYRANKPAIKAISRLGTA